MIMVAKNKKIWWVTAVLLFSFLCVVVAKELQNTGIYDISTLIFTITNFTTIILVVRVFDAIQLKNSRKSVGELKVRLVPSFFIFFISIAIISLVIYSMGDFLLYLAKGWEIKGYMKGLFGRLLSSCLPLSIGIFIASIVFFYNMWHQAVSREQSLREENLKYKYRNLKAQINPHFLFNSLNTLSEMIHENINSADDYIQKLAVIYRYILDNEEKDLITLDEEIKFVKDYFLLHRERNKGKIELKINIDNAGRFNIIPVSLQILVENALKHNIASTANPLVISIDRDDKMIIVSNNLQKKNILADSAGIGLSNLNERARLILGKEIIVKCTEKYFTVKLPIEKI